MNKPINKLGRAQQIKRARCRGSALLLVIALLPVFSSLSIDALQRDNHSFLNNIAHADLSHLHNAAMHHLASAARLARNGVLVVGEIHALDNADSTIKTHRVVRPLGQVGSGGLVGFAVDAHAVRAPHNVILRMTFVWRDGGSPQNGVWHVSKI